MNTRLIGAFLAVGVAAVCSAHAGQLFSQAWDGGADYWASQDDPSSLGSFATVYDTFTLAQTATITGATWVGTYFNPPQQGTITGFTVDFYNTLGGAPGNVLASYSIAGNANETFLADPYQYFYSYAAGLGGFTADAGTQYWISIQATMNFPPQWGWATGNGPGDAYQTFFESTNPIGSSQAFSLSGSSSVPDAASSALLFGAGLLCLCLTGRLKNARQH